MGRPKKRRRATGASTSAAAEGNTEKTSVVTGAGDSEVAATGASTSEKNAWMDAGVLEMSDVRIDEGALAAEADAVAAEYHQPATEQQVLGAMAAQVTGDDPHGVTATQEEILAGYVMVCDVVVGQGYDALVPAWSVTAPERSKLATALAKAALLWFPDQIIPPKYMALLTIAGVGFEIANARRDPATGKLKPMRHAESRKDEAA